MAEGKKSFVAYSDWDGMFKALPDEIAGKLIKHIFSYVNDQNPESDDFVINALFEQIKATLKRDLKKWESQREQRSEAGKKSAELRALTKSNERSISLNETQRNSTVSVNVSVKEKDINNSIDSRKLKFAQSLIPFLDSYGKDMIRDFCDYWSEPNKSKTKFKMELQKTWDTERRLRSWNKNDFNKTKENKKEDFNQLLELTNSIRNQQK